MLCQGIFLANAYSYALLGVLTLFCHIVNPDGFTACSKCAHCWHRGQTRDGDLWLLNPSTYLWQFRLLFASRSRSGLSTPPHYLVSLSSYRGRVFAEFLVGLGFLWSVSCIKPIPTHEKVILLREKSDPNATFFTYFLFWVGLAFGLGVCRFQNNI